MRLPAVAVSRGIGTGKLVFVAGEKRKHFRREVDGSQIESEVTRFLSALTLAVNNLNRLSFDSPDNGSSPSSDIFDVQAVILESSIRDKVIETIRNEKVDAEWAVRAVADVFIERQAAVADERFREKIIDIEDAVERLFAAMQATSTVSNLEPGCVVATGDLRPSALIEFAKIRPAAIIIEHGGWTSHVSILARELKIPMVSGVTDIDRIAADGCIVMVDGLKGEIVLNPSPDSIEQAENAIAMNQLPQMESNGNSNGLVTLDNVGITIRTNTDSAHSYGAASLLGAQGIGLFRSESILERSGAFPSEEEQFITYREIADATGINGVKIRTFDIGAIHDDDRRSVERNPALGLRAIRYGLTEVNIFKTQVRAILRASYDRRIDIILPMISGVDDVIAAKTMISNEADVLSRVGTAIGEPRLGVMIETPSAVITARSVAKLVDFMCIGTNDLVQYLLAVDRDNESVADWYQSLHPAVLWSIREVISVAASEKIPVTVCGEMAGSPFYVPLLLGLGVREFSMNLTSIEPVMHLIRGIDLEQCTELASLVETLETADDIQSELRTFYRTFFPHLFPPGLLDTKQN